jgi:CHAD domain-containing protein
MGESRDGRDGVDTGRSVQPVSHVEREVKLEAGLRFTMPDLSGVYPGVVVTALPDARLQATYIDTADFRLMRWGITLRHRQDTAGGANAESGWTLKLPAEAEGVALARQELFWPGKPGAIPAEVVHLVRATARAAPLEQVARLTTQRRRIELRDTTGQRLAEVDDDVVSVMDGRKLAARFREVEVELTPAAPAGFVQAVLDRLTAAGAVQGDDRPKVVRAVGPRATSGPDVVVPQLDEDATVGEVVAASIGSAATRVIRHDPGVRQGQDPEHVHQARVGTRRLRSDLRTFRHLLDAEWTGRVRSELGWLAEALGDVRDADVLSERLAAQVGALPGADRRPASVILKRLTKQRDDARARLIEVLDSERYVTLLEELTRAAADPPLVSTTGGDAVDPPGEVAAAVPVAGEQAPSQPTPLQPMPASTAAVQPAPPAPPEAPPALPPAAPPALPQAAASMPAARCVRAAGSPNGNGSASPPGGPQLEASHVVPLGDRPARDVLPQLVRRPWKHLRRAVEALGDDPPDHALHEVRIRAKRIRYAAEAAAAVTGKPARKLAGAVAELQGVLGDMQDAVVAEGWLRHEATSMSPAQALTAGELVAMQRQDKAACRAAWPDAWKAASTKRLLSWLKG